MIVKIQMPIDSTLEGPPALVYSKEKQLNMLIPVTNVLRLAMGDKVKRYFEVEINGEDLHLLHEVEPQPW